MAYRFTRSRAKRSRKEDEEAYSVFEKHREQRFSKRINELVPGATPKTFEIAFGPPALTGIYLLGIHGIYSKEVIKQDAVVELLTDALRIEKEHLEKEEAEKAKKAEMEQEKIKRRERRRKRRRVLEEELAQLKKEEEEEGVEIHEIK